MKMNVNFCWLGDDNARERRDAEMRAQGDYDYPVEDIYRCTFFRADQLDANLLSGYLRRSLKLAQIYSDGLDIDVIAAKFIADLSQDTAEREMIVEGEYIFLTLKLQPWLIGEKLSDCSYCFKIFAREKHGYVYDYKRHGWGKYLRDGMNYEHSRLGSVLGVQCRNADTEVGSAIAGLNPRFAVVLNDTMLNSCYKIGLYRANYWYACNKWTRKDQGLQKRGAVRVTCLDRKCNEGEYVGLLSDSRSYEFVNRKNIQVLRQAMDQYRTTYSLDNLEILAVHREVPPTKLKIFKIGQFKEEVYWRFVNLYNQRLKKMVYSVVDHNGAFRQSRCAFKERGASLEQIFDEECSDYVSMTRDPLIFPDMAFCSMLLF